MSDPIDIPQDDVERDPYSAFQKDLEGLINQHSLEGQSDTPDFILAAFMVSALKAFSRSCNERTDWYRPADLKPLTTLDE